MFNHTEWKRINVSIHSSTVQYVCINTSVSAVFCSSKLIGVILREGTDSQQRHTHTHTLAKISQQKRVIIHKVMANLWVSRIKDRFHTSSWILLYNSCGQITVGDELGEGSNCLRNTLVCISSHWLMSLPCLVLGIPLYFQLKLK